MPDQPVTFRANVIAIQHFSPRGKDGLVILRHKHRRIISIAVTPTPSAEWIEGQVTDAFP
jgi:hypothetical protein